MVVIQFLGSQRVQWMSWIFAVLFFSIPLYADKPKAISHKSEGVQREVQIYEKGRVLSRNTCVACHSSQSTVAPDFQQIQEIYKKRSQPRAYEGLFRFLTTQSEASILWPEAQKKFGVMPKMNLAVEDAHALAVYISTSHFKDLEFSSESSSESLQDKGKRIVALAKGEIGQNLMRAIKDKKTVGAIEFCNERAIPITLSHAQISKAQIKRATDKPRNPQNLADNEELKYIRQFQKELAAGQTPQAILVSSAGEQRYYSPILTNSMCLQCHGAAPGGGTEETVAQEVYDKIQKLYPQDKAMGYKADQVRGVFSVRWKP